MFVVGEIEGKVINGKLALPKVFHLKKRKLFGKWKDQDTLYLSDNDKSLNYTAGKKNGYFPVDLDYEERISIPDVYENCYVDIEGCISTIRLKFINEKEE